MPTKTQSVSRPKQPAAQNSDGFQRNEIPISSQSNGHSQDAHARISERAYALYEERGREDDRALEDWLAAERQVLNQG